MKTKFVKNVSDGILVFSDLASFEAGEVRELPAEMADILLRNKDMKEVEKKEIKKANKKVKMIEEE